MKAKKVLAGLAAQQANGTLCDIELQAEQQTIPAHKGVLAAATPYFEAMFTGNFDESKARIVEIKEVTFTGLKNVVQSIYTDQIDINAENIADILPAAHLLQMADILRQCRDWMRKHTTKDNCFDFLQLAEKLNIDSVEAAITDFILKNFGAVSEMEGFQQISQQALCRYLSSDLVKTDMNEYSVYKAAKDWILKNNITDVTVIFDIMQNVRFALIPLSTLSGQVLTDDLIEGNKPFRLMVAEAIEYHANVYCQPFYKGTINKPRGKPGVLVIPNGPRQGDSYTANSNGKIDFLPMPALKPARESISLNMPIVYDSMSVVQINNFLFLFGCISNSTNKYQNFTMRYDASNDSWMKMEPVPREPTVGSRVAFVEDKKQILLMGGMKVDATMHFEFDDDEILANTYIYEIMKNAWSPGTDLPQGLVYPGVATLKDIAYVTGGFPSLDETVDSVYGFDMKGKLWLTKAKMKRARCQHMLSAIDDKLYAVGGRVIGGESTSSIEMYDTVCNQWTLTLKLLQVPLCAGSLLVNDNTIYVIGGTNTRKKIHVYDTNNLHKTQLPVELPSNSYRNVSALLTLPKLL